MKKESVSHYFDPREIEIVTELHGKEERFNPRTLNNPGFSAEKMQDLRAGICRDGLNHAILVRIDEKGKPHLIAGERRLRAVLGLIEADEEAKSLIESGDKDVQRVMCKNPRTKKMEPALTVYGEYGVECKVADSHDEKETLRQAIQENTLHEGLTDYELLLQCKKMEEASISRADQAETMGVSEAWISQSHSLLEADPSILDCMEKQQLTRTAALTFLNIPKDKVAAVLQRALALTYQAAEEKELEAVGELARARDEIQVNEAKLRLSQFTGNTESARKARKQVARASRTVAKAEDKVKKVRENKGKKLTVETIKTAAKEVNAAENLGQPQATSHVRVVAQEVADLLKSDEDTITFNGKEYSRDDVAVVQGVIRWYLNRNHCEHPLDVIDAIRNEELVPA